MAQLFDLSPSCAAQSCVMQALGELFAQSPTFRCLAEDETVEDARKRIILGPHVPPWDEAEYSVEELATLFCQVQIWAPGELTETYTSTGNLGTEPYRQGRLAACVRRFIRPIEATDRNKLYLHLVSAFDLIGNEVFTLAEQQTSPRLLAFEAQSPCFASPSHRAGQGDFAHWHYFVDWGDFEVE